MLTKIALNSRVTQVSTIVLVAMLSSCAVAPKPMTHSERSEQMKQDTIDMFTGQEAVSAPITMEDAIARALKYNLDNRLKMMEEALSQHQLNTANFNLLPKLTANAGYGTRDNDYGSQSLNLLTNERLATSSTSQDKDHTFGDLTLSWNILDFGVSYFQAKQQADQLLILQERRRKVVQTMTQQVRQAYWQAVGAQLLESKINVVIANAEKALNDSRTIESERLRSPVEALNYQRQMLDTLRQLEIIRDELTQAKPRLASVMNMPPSENFQVVIPGQLDIPEVKTELSKMEETALLNRPELMEASYNERISVLETRKAIARLFPGIELSAGAHYDSNSFLVNETWNAAGIRVGWNLFNLFNASNIKKTAAAQLEVSQKQRLALHMAVLTQVNVAYRDYLSRKHQFERNRDISSVEERLLTYTRNSASSNAESRAQEIRASASALMSELRLYQSYGLLQSSYGQILATLGVDLLPANLPNNSVTSLSHAVTNAQQKADLALGTVYSSAAISATSTPQ